MKKFKLFFSFSLLFFPFTYASSLYASCTDPLGAYLQDVALYDGSLGPSQEFIHTHQGAVVRLNGNCSGTFLPGNLVLTAGHCFSSSATGMYVDFNYQLDANGILESPLQTYDVTDIVEYYLGSVDYAILEIEPTAADNHPVARLSSELPINNYDVLTSISHSGGQPKRIGTGTFDNYSTGGWYQVANLSIQGGASGSSLLDEAGHTISTVAGTGCTVDGTEFAAGGPSIRKLLEISPTIREIFDAYAEDYNSGYMNDFESGIQWSNIGEFYWSVISGVTPTPNTGPSTSTGKYIYFETANGSANTAGDEASIVSHPFIINENGNTFFEFDYHMYGSNTGTLYAEVFDGFSWTTLWSRSGQQHSTASQAWTQAQIDLSAYTGNVKVRFRAVAAGGAAGNIAIDNIELPDFSPIIDKLTDGYTYITTAWPNATGQSLHIEYGTLESSSILSGWYSAHWQFKVIDGKYVKITNRWTGDSLHTENGSLEASTAPDNWLSAHWELEPVPALADAYRLRNRYRSNQYLNIENMQLQSSNVSAGYWSSYWYLPKL